MRKNQPFSLSKLQELSQPLIKVMAEVAQAGGSTRLEI
jgi:hypothetical protein